MKSVWQNTLELAEVTHPNTASLVQSSPIRDTL